ncbi:MAG: tRNA uridine-5-carboxymethylaminomethyl(34) synthesis GTPase MnmE [Clostridia bacterium]|nr:tRNA uridine-5-carboxymethylaminomethyl(34) synthesis GTPase MnmE [Clostridia bacterium]
MTNETIAAIATPHGSGGISVIRISGPKSIEIADKVFSAKNKKTLASSKTHTLHYGFISDGEKNIDEVLVSVMRAPNTFTREDTVEINCHGGLVVTEAVLSCILKAGASLATPGEFTKRAFLNGRLDLSQAEAVIDIINSPSEIALSAAANQLGGALSEEINKLRSIVLEVLAKINANIDYPEEDIDEYETKDLLSDLISVKEKLSKLLLTTERGKLIKDGIDTVICGKPNVGKSSVLNLLARENRAIVTDIAGTTRDVIEERITLGGVVLNVFDTAGIRKTDDKIESLGIDKSREYINKAELVLFVVDSSDEITNDDLEIYNTVKDKNLIILCNKSDLGRIKDLSKFSNASLIEISAKTGDGLTKLSNTIEEKFKLGEISSQNNTVITNLRHKEALSHALSSLERAINSLSQNMPYDLVSIDITDSASSLGEITGKTISEEVVDKIFARFCLGK